MKSLNHSEIMLEADDFGMKISQAPIFNLMDKARNLNEQK